MNYFEILNKVLLELNYRPLEDFGRIYKSEHQKILDAINRVNKEVLASYEWPFLERTAKITVPAGENACSVPFDGMIKAVYQVTKASAPDAKDETGLNGHYKKLLYHSDTINLCNESISGDFQNHYSLIPACCRQKTRFIVPKTAQQRDYAIIYLSTNYVMAPDGSFKGDFSGKNDVSTIPMPYAEQLLVYGTCLKIKANPAYPKFGFWNTLYIQALGNLRQKSPQTKECEPFISIA